jgi:isochorismate hydrolase
LCSRAAIDAYQRDLNVIIPREAAGPYDRDHEGMSLRYMDGKIACVMPLAALMSYITKKSPG